MKKQIYSFPSVYETVGTDLKFVSKTLDKGIQLYDNEGQGYLVGNLALTEGRAPNKLINSSPNEIDYQLLLKSSLLLASEKKERPFVLTTGFPFSTYQVYKNAAHKLIKDLNEIKYNPGTYSDKGKTKLNVNIDKVEILPEMIGNIIALRAGEAQAEGNFFVVSFGYGTCEAVLSTEDGIVHRTSTSITGMQYAVDLFMRSLATKYYLGLKTEKQLDISFRNDYIILDRKKIDIRDLRKRILERYYKDVVSIGLKKSFSDNDFELANTIYVTGGGALFPDLVDELRNEFNEVATVNIVNNPLTLTSEGYSLNSIMLADGDTSAAIGLDIGNANTVLTQYVDETQKTKSTTAAGDSKSTTNKVAYVQEGTNKKNKNNSVNKDAIRQADENIAKQLINVVDEMVAASSKKNISSDNLQLKKEKQKEETAALSDKERNILLRENDTANQNTKKNDIILDEFQPVFS